MIADHQKLNEQLMRFAGNQEPRDENVQRTNAATNGQTREQVQNNPAPRAGSQNQSAVRSPASRIKEKFPARIQRKVVRTAE